MSEDLLGTKDVARYLGVHEKQVYALVKAGRIPATRVTGKWLFPKRLLDEVLEQDARAGLQEARHKGNRVGGAILAAGSNDPVLDILQSSLRSANPGLYLFSAATGSTAGLSALNEGYTDLAFCHLWDPASGDFNVPFLSKLAPKVKPVVVNLFCRELGLICLSGNPKGIGGVPDLARPSVRMVNRQPGSGTRLLLDHHLGEAGIDPASVKGYDREAVTHYEVAFAVLSGEADAGLATRAVAVLLGLDFIPVARERFDMVMDQAAFFNLGIQALVGLLGSADFRDRVSRMGNYDFSQAGKLIPIN